MPVFSVLEFAGLSYSALFQVLAFSVLGCIFFFCVHSYNSTTAHGNGCVDDTVCTQVIVHVSNL